MIKRIEQAFLQRRNIDGQQAYKTVLNITTNWKMQIKSTMRQPYISSRIDIIKKQNKTENKGHLRCQEATVRTGHGKTNWFQIGKGVHQGYILSPSLFNLYAEYIMRNAGLEEAQAGIKIAGRNTNNLRYADDTTLMAESEG